MCTPPLDMKAFLVEREGVDRVSKFQFLFLFMWETFSSKSFVWQSIRRIVISRVISPSISLPLSLPLSLFLFLSLSVFLSVFLPLPLSLSLSSSLFLPPSFSLYPSLALCSTPYLSLNISSSRPVFVTFYTQLGRWINTDSYTKLSLGSVYTCDFEHKLAHNSVFDLLQNVFASLFLICFIKVYIPLLALVAGHIILILLPS
jgi:hypothetical protein